MSQPSHRSCPVCGIAFFAGEPVLECSGCRAILHTACWIETGGCPTPSDHDDQAQPRTFGGPPPLTRPAAPPPPPDPTALEAPLPERSPAAEGAVSPAPPVTAPPLDRRPLRRTASIGSLGPRSRGRRRLLRFWYVPVGLLLAGAVAFGVVTGIDRLRGGDEGSIVAALPTESPTANSTDPPAGASAAATPRPTPSPATPTPPPAAAEASPAGRFAAGDVAIVSGTGSCLNVRNAASIGGAIIDCIADGTRVTVLEGPVEAGNLNWWRIEGPEIEGWAAGVYLAEP